jgi:DNA glycosylase AlkZ-like
MSATWERVFARRMARQGLDAPAIDAGPAEIASVMCGAHAQVLSAAELSIARRISGATQADVRRALWDDRTLVKTFGPRGTVHLLATTELPMWTGALSALPSSVPQHPDPVRFSPEQGEEVIAAIGDALADEELTVDELTSAIEKRTGAWAVERTMDAFQVKWPRWRQLTSTAAHRGVLCFGANRGRNVTYTNPHRWLPGFSLDEPKVALGNLVTRYLCAYGPASPDYFAKWLGIAPRHATELFDRLAGGDVIEALDVEGEGSWVASGDRELPQKPHRGVRLLPYFDAYVIACQPRPRLFPAAAAARALTPSGSAGSYPVMLVDGVVGGVWHMRRTGKQLAITVEPLKALTAKHRRQLADEVDLIGAVLDGRPTLKVGKVTAGAHA